jgi:hypothetical protein
MPLQPLSLDNLTWADFVAASMQRIPADSAGRWTLHAPVDPGVTLIELYAWFFDQRVYWIDQVPDSLTRALMALLGITPNPAQAATTLLYLRLVGAGSSQAVPVANASKVWLEKGLNPPVFTTTQDVMVLPLAAGAGSTGVGPLKLPRIGLRVGSTDRTTDLAQGRAPALLADGADTTITLPLDPTAVSKAAGGVLGLYFELKTASGIQPEWLPGASAIPGPGALTWSYSTAKGPTGFDLLLMSSVGDVGDIPTAGKTLVIVADVSGVLHFRIFEGDGRIVVDTDESRLTAQTGPIADLKKRLEDLWPPHQPGEEVKGQVVTAVTSIVGYTRPTPFAAGAVTDGTNGLRRSGVVRVKVPADWSAGTGTGLSLILRSAPSSSPYPPRLARLIPNVVTIVNTFSYQSQSPNNPADQADINKQVGKWARRPGNVLVLPEGARPPIAETVVVTMTERVGAKQWQPVADLGPYGPGDRVYVVEAGAARLRFGDGLNGRLPSPVGAEPVTVSCTVGGGKAGNLGSNLAWEFEEIDGVEAVNVVPAEGGKDAETLAEARNRAASELRQSARAVTQSDFEAIARATPGAAVARAHAAIGRHPALPGRVVAGAVTVFLVPDLPRKPDGSPDPGVGGAGGVVLPPGPAPDAAVVCAVQQRLDATRLITSEVYVRPPNYRPVALAVTVNALAPDTQALRANITAALAAYLDPLVGGDDGDGWPFGGPLRPSSLLHVVQDALGNAGTAALVTIRLEDTDRPAEGCDDVPIGPDDLVVLTAVDITVQRPTAGRGGLR